MRDTDSGKENAPPCEELEEVVRQSVTTMRFVTVEIVIHEGCVTQVAATEKIRLAGKDGLSG